MTMSVSLTRYLPKKFWFSAILVSAVLVFSFLPHDKAVAAIDPSNPFGFSCDMTQYGFTTGIVYCFKQDLGTATTQYISTLSSFLTDYFWLAMVLAISLFGVRLITMGSEELLKESALLLFKLAIGAYIFFNAASLYTSLSGVMSELIGFVSQNFNFLSASCTDFPLTAVGGGNEYSIWQAIDCMSETLVGVTTNAANTQIYSSVLMIIAAAIFTSTLGLMAAFAGIGVILSAFFMIMRALYFILLAYLTLAFMMILAPLAAPLLFFASHKTDGYTRAMFDRWAGLILSSLLEPMFIIGFLAMAVQIMDTFIDDPSGLLASCLTVNSVSDPVSVTNPATVTDMSSICSVKALFTPCQDTSTTPPTYNKCIEPGAVLFSSYGIGGDPQGHSTGNTTDGNFSYSSYAVNQVQHLVTQAYQFLATGGNVEIVGPQRFRAVAGTNAPAAPLLPLLLTLLAFLLAGLILLNLLQDIVSIARRIAGQLGTAMYQGAQLPFQNMLQGMGGRPGALDAAQQGVRQSRGEGNSVPRSVIDGGSAGFRNIIDQGL